MINNLKYLFLTVFCAIFLVGAIKVSAQKMNKSDAAGMIEFYEWAFETDFSPAQRSEFQRLLEDDFRNDAAKTRRDTDTVLEAFAKIKGVNAEARRETRRAFLGEFLPDLKKNESSDAEAAFLLKVFRESHSGNDEFTVMDAATGDVFDKRINKVTTIEGDANYYGKWSRSVGSGQVDYTGKTQYRSGETYIFEFLPNGTLNYSYDKDVLAITQCTIKETNRASGTVEVSGDTMTMHLGAMSSVGTGTCDKNNNFRRTLEASTLTKTFVVKKLQSILRPDEPLILCFEGQKDEDCFEKVR